MRERREENEVRLWLDYDKHLKTDLQIVGFVGKASTPHDSLKKKFFISPYLFVSLFVMSPFSLISS